MISQQYRSALPLHPRARLGCRYIHEGLRSQQARAIRIEPWPHDIHIADLEGEYYERHTHYMQQYVSTQHIVNRTEHETEKPNNPIQGLRTPKTEPKQLFNIRKLCSKGCVESRTQLPIVIGLTLAHGHT